MLWGPRFAKRRVKSAYGCGKTMQKDEAFDEEQHATTSCANVTPWKYRRNSCSLLWIQECQPTYQLETTCVSPFLWSFFSSSFSLAFSFAFSFSFTFSFSFSFSFSFLSFLLSLTYCKQDEVSSQILLMKRVQDMARSECIHSLRVLLVFLFVFLCRRRILSSTYSAFSILFDSLGLAESADVSSPSFSWLP